MALPSFSTPHDARLIAYVPDINNNVRTRWDEISLIHIVGPGASYGYEKYI